MNNTNRIIFRMKYLVFPVLLVLSLGGAGAEAQSKFAHLKTWVGKYPTDSDTKPVRRFFALPEVRDPLQKLLDQKDLQRLTKEYSVETPIELIDNYLVIHVCKPHDCDGENATLAINMDNGAIHVGIWDGKDKKWHSSSGSDKDLPKKIQESIGSGG
jgi:hypothetical protein